jgi:nitrate reductase delta subunit
MMAGMTTMASDVRAAPRLGPLRLGAFRQDAEHVRALERVKSWTRESLALAADDTILVSEAACGRPGCPPLETVIAFWTGAEQRHVFKVFKPVAEVTFEDLPPAWLKDALYAADPIDGECC